MGRLQELQTARSTLAGTRPSGTIERCKYKFVGSSAHDCKLRREEEQRRCVVVRLCGWPKTGVTSARAASKIVDTVEFGPAKGQKKGVIVVVDSADTTSMSGSDLTSLMVRTTTKTRILTVLSSDVVSDSEAQPDVSVPVTEKTAIDVVSDHRIDVSKVRYHSSWSCRPRQRLTPEQNAEQNAQHMSGGF